MLQCFFLFHHNGIVIFLVLGNFHIFASKHFRNTVYIFVATANYNISFLIQGQGKFRHTNSTANGIVVFVGMSHNENFISSLHLLVNGLRHNTSTHASTFCRHGRCATEELSCFVLHDNRLVATTAQR